MKNISRNSYLKQLKNGRLKFPIKLYLRYCGRRDARKKVVQKDDSGIFLSPFICQQIYLYNLAVQIEEENFINSVLPVEAESEIFQLQIERKEQVNGKIDHSIESFVNDNSDLEQNISILKAKSIELMLLKDKEEKIKQIKCEQLYSILQTRISTYWDGVMQVCGDELKISPIVIINHLIKER